MPLLLVLATGWPARGAPKSWDSSTDGSWDEPANWDPTGVPLAGDDATLGNLAGTEGTRTSIDSTTSIASLTLVNGNELETGGFEITVNGGASLDGTSTTLVVVPRSVAANDAFDANFLDATGGSVVRMLGGRLEVDGQSGDGRLDLDASTLVGYGFIDLEGSASGSKLTSTAGSLAVGNTVDGGLLPITDPARTLEISATDAAATVDLDQASATLSVLPAGTLDLNVPLNDPFSSTLTLSRKSTLDIEDPWSFDGTLEVNTGPGAFAIQTAGPATIAGGAMTQTGGTIHFDAPSDELILDAPFAATGGTIELPDGSLTFNANTTIGPGVDLNIDADADGDTELVVNALVLIEPADWDWDGAGLASNVITIGDSGVLTADIDFSATSFSGTLNLDGGGLVVAGTETQWGLTGGQITAGNNSTSVIAGDPFEIFSGNLTVEDGATLQFNPSGPPGNSGPVFSGGTLTIDGTLDLNGDFYDWNGSTVNGSGEIKPGDHRVIGNQTINVATYDWDDGLSIIGSGASLILDVTNIDVGNDSYDNRTIDNNGGTLAVTVADGEWELRNSAFLNLNGDATLAQGSTLRVHETSAILTEGTGNQIDTDVILEEGAVLSVGEGESVVLGGDDDTVTLAGGDLFLANPGGTIVNNGTLRVTGDSSVLGGTFDWDEGPTVIESGASLMLDIIQFDQADPSDRYDSRLDINGGSFEMISDVGYWVMDGTLAFDGGGSLAGDELRVGDDAGTADANFFVGGGGVAELGMSTTWYSDTDLVIEAGSILRSTKTMTFSAENGGANASFTGSGTWQMGGQNRFSEPTTIDMPGGTIDLDNSWFPGTPEVAYDVEVTADTTLNVGTLADYGNLGFDGESASCAEIYISDDASLTVNLDDPEAHWTVNEDGIIRYTNLADVPGNTFLDGSDLLLQGTMIVAEGGSSSARLDIEGTVTIRGSAHPAGAGFQLSSTFLSAPNRLSGGLIDGSGPLRIPTFSALTGHGEITTQVVGESDSSLRADDGILTLSGPLIRIGHLGATADGTLNVVQAWNTNQVDSIGLGGSELSGGTITNDHPAGISTNGLISAPVINNTTLDALGTLVLTNPGSDWDGSTETGMLRTNFFGNIEIHDTFNAESFSGTLSITQDREIFLSGFNLDCDSDSTLTLTGGTLRSDANQVLGGTISVASNASTLQTDASLTSTAIITLGDDLNLTGDTSVAAGASFAGGGALINGPGSTLSLLDGAAVAVLLENSGRVRLGDSPGQTTGTDYQQNAGATLEIEIQDTGLADYDRMALTGIAQLAGTLEVSLLNEFSPGLGTTFTILTAAGGIVNEFENEDFSGAPLGPGLAWQVNHNATNVQLEVVEGDSAFTEWIATFPQLGDPADQTAGANPDGDQLDNFGEFGLDGDPTRGANSGKLVGRIAPVGGVDSWTLTCPMRTGTVVDAGDPAGGELVLVQVAEGVTYTVQAGDDPATFPLEVTEVTGPDATAIQAGLPALSSADWTYRSFRSPGPVDGDPGEFMRIRVSP